MRKRSGLQFGLLGLFLFMTIVALVLGALVSFPSWLALSTLAFLILVPLAVIIVKS